MLVYNRFKGSWTRIVQNCSREFSTSRDESSENDEPSEPLGLDNDFKKFLHYHDSILVLTGAGISTDSGIPDYRSEDGLFNRTSYKPIQYSEFIKNEEARRRYWARNYIGWPNFSSRDPNEAHFYLQELECRTTKILSIVTQNVDGLHRRAGSQNLIELHGNAFWVKCLKCGETVSRFDFQRTLQKYNPSMEAISQELRPDGDVELKEEDTKNFKVPDCEKCGGILKPTVVFFGENVPPKRVEKVEELVKQCDSMLILGTTASTLSSFRIVEQAYKLCKFLCLINLGPTRIDKMVDLKFDSKINEVLPRMEV